MTLHATHDFPTRSSLASHASSAIVSWRAEGLRIGKGWIRASPCGIKMPRNRPWAEDVQRDLGRMMAMGIEVRFFRAYAPPGYERKDAGLKAIGLTHFTSTFGFLLAFHVLALIVFCFEMAFKVCVS